MGQAPEHDALHDDCRRHFAELVDGTGIKRFASSLNVSTRQVNRMLSNAQPNPIERLIRCLQAVQPEIGDRVLDYICQELGGHFGREQITVLQPDNLVGALLSETPGQRLVGHQKATVPVLQIDPIRQQIHDCA